MTGPLVRLTPAPLWIAGVDEVGRGALFGPVVTAAVVLDRDAASRLSALGVTDSKALSATRREQFAEEIYAIAPAVGIGAASVAEIDRVNILQATFLAMRRAIATLDPQPHLCAVDGNRAIPKLAIPQQTIVKGDRHDLAIGAASIVAKVWRDREIVALAERYPGYDLARNKGYGTANHKQGLGQRGVTDQHRLSFKPCRDAAASQLSCLQDI